MVFLQYKLCLKKNLNAPRPSEHLVLSGFEFSTHYCLAFLVHTAV